MAKQLDLAEEIEGLAKSIIEKEKLFDSVQEPSIGYVVVSPYITKTVVARCIRANNELKFFSDHDYVIEVSDDIWKLLDETEKEAVVLHELLHIYPLHNDKTGDYSYKLLDHDLKDFKKVIKKYGPEWDKEIKNKLANLYDYNPEDYDNVSL